MYYQVLIILYHWPQFFIFRSVENVIKKYHDSVDALAVIANIKFPLDSTWPNIGISAYHLLDASMQNVTGCTASTSILPIVQPSQLSDFEDYALPFLNQETVLAGKFQLFRLVGGVWVFNQYGPMHDTTGETSFSNRNIIVPILNPPLSLVEGGLVLGNLHALIQAGNGRHAPPSPLLLYHHKIYIYLYIILINCCIVCPL